MLNKQLDQTIEPISEPPVINYEASLDSATNFTTYNEQSEQIFGRLLPVQTGHPSQLLGIVANPNQPPLANMQSSGQIIGFFSSLDVPAPIVISGDVAGWWDACCDCCEFCCYDGCEIM